MFISVCIHIPRDDGDWIQILGKSFFFGSFWSLKQERPMIWQTHCYELQHTTTNCNTMQQHIKTLCNTLPHIEIWSGLLYESFERRRPVKDVDIKMWILRYGYAILQSYRTSQPYNFTIPYNHNTTTPAYLPLWIAMKTWNDFAMLRSNCK